MKKKQLTEEQSLEISKQLRIAYEAWGKIWSISMKGMPISSPAYRSICKAGNSINNARQHLIHQVEAQDGLTEIKLHKEMCKLAEYINFT